MSAFETSVTLADARLISLLHVIRCVRYQQTHERCPPNVVATYVPAQWLSCCLPVLAYGSRLVYVGKLVRTRNAVRSFSSHPSLRRGILVAVRGAVACFTHSQTFRVSCLELLPLCFTRCSAWRPHNAYLDNTDTLSARGLQNYTIDDGQVDVGHEHSHTSFSQADGETLWTRLLSKFGELCTTLWHRRSFYSGIWFELHFGRGTHHCQPHRSEQEHSSAHLGSSFGDLDAARSSPLSFVGCANIKEAVSWTSTSSTKTGRGFLQLPPNKPV